MALPPPWAAAASATVRHLAAAESSVLRWFGRCLPSSRSSEMTVGVSKARPKLSCDARPNRLQLPPRLVAFHEAAHAVVARKLGCTIERVAIAANGGGDCVHVTADTYQVAGTRRIHGTPNWRATTLRERATMARRQRDASLATVALAGVAMEDIARAVPVPDLLPAIETVKGNAQEGLQRRSSSDIRVAAESCVRQHRTDAGRQQFFRRARARAAKLLLRNWPALDAVAGALLEQRTLDGREVDRLMHAARR